MKYLFKIFLPIVLISMIWARCEKDEAKVLFEGGVAPVLAASTEHINLNFADADEVGLILNWTNPNYKFNNGVSSQTVQYQLEIDLAENNFNNPAKKVISLNGDLGYKFKVSEINDILLNQLGLSTGQNYNLSMRVIAFLDSKYSKLISNVVNMDGTPYAIPPKIAVPAEGNLWIVGDCVANGWENPLKPEYINSHKFTKVSETQYELTIDLTTGEGYKLIQENGVWGSQYHALSGGTWEAGDFEKADAEPKFPGPGQDGTFKISIDFQRGKYSVIKL